MKPPAPPVFIPQSSSLRPAAAALILMENNSQTVSLSVGPRSHIHTNRYENASAPTGCRLSKAACAL
ncbi:hypothetical protein EYF80_014580 [Liparis tanakae]|uniref:Uncharacterized protein n=1 Tax=Liparis tanakae TaxID=230148 RepID=A0A4Z2IB96_9TELE|nr:hypothetical protein EYF80_014580 [Liparis tanakae]